MQLVAYGAQDIYLTGNPQITFFKVVYRRHTNFSMESIKQTLTGTQDFGNEVTATISRNGDLVYRIYLEHKVKIGDDTTTTHNKEIMIGSDYGSYLLKECELEIGGQRIDRYFGDWSSVYSSLTTFNPSGENYTNYNRTTGNGLSFLLSQEGLNRVAPEDVNGWIINDDLLSNANAKRWPSQEDAVGNTDTLKISKSANGHMFIPLHFWFCRNPGLALPLIALQYHEVKVKMTIEELKNLAYIVTRSANLVHDQPVTEPPASGQSFDLWCDYIYLDTDERRRFAQVSHEYLIEQLQHVKKPPNNATRDLNFNHPVKELIWTTKRNIPTKALSTGTDTEGVTPYDGLITDGDEYDIPSITAFSKPSLNSGSKFKLTLNGQDRFRERDRNYFTRVQIHEKHTGFGGIPVVSEILNGGAMNPGYMDSYGSDSIAVYSFALKPEEHQPSGTCNFSRIDTVQLIESQNSSPQELTIYAVNYNVLRIMSGMGGLAYSN